jgi:hypothetical protein
MAASQEMYSWPGAARFEDREIERVLPPGAFGTGPFAAGLLGIFAIRDPHFILEGDSQRNGRRLMEYSFAVTEPQSHYRAKAGDQWLITGYTGTLLVDPATAELVQLTVRTEELPAATHACEVDTTLEYGTVRLRGEDFLLPAFTQQRFIEQDGSEAENSIRFSACRDFQAESAVSFGAVPKLADATPQTAGAAFELPVGLPVTVELISSIRADQASAGDRIEGRLAEPVRDVRRGLLLPHGAKVFGV